MSREELHQALKAFLEKAEKPLVAVMGPTASGKTALAVEIAQAFSGEVINADSRQVYQEMEIGNELTKPEEMQGIPHHLLSCVPLSQTMSVAEYMRQAQRIIRDIHARQKLPILCGGTSLWIDAVVDNYRIPEGDGDPSFRAAMDKRPLDDLLQELKEIDPLSYEQLKEQRNKRYIIRALEVFHLTGQPKSTQAQKGPRLYEVFKLAPEQPREEIYQRINRRTERQLDQGMVPEVQALVDRYADGEAQKLLELGWPGITSIGCKEVIPYLQGDIDRATLLRTLQQNNRRYAKRQLTWLRRDHEINWVTI